MDSHVVRNVLNTRRSELRNRLERVRRDGRHAGGLQQDLEEQAIEQENDDVLARLEIEIHEEMLAIDRSLQRIDKGRYGICERCGKPIAKKRLEALPYAATCTVCGDTRGA